MEREELASVQRDNGRRESIERLRALSVTGAHSGKECERIRKTISSIAENIGKEAGDGPET